MPRPWIRRTSRKPRAWAASRYSATTEGTSRGTNECRSSASSIGTRTGSPGSATASESGTGHHVLLPVLVAQEILSCELALSERGGALEERDIDDDHALRLRRLDDLLGHHLPNERDR